MTFETTTHRLSDVINIIGGGTPKRKIEEYWHGDISWLSVVDFNSSERYVDDAVEKITELGLKKSSTKLLEAGQIIISARGTVGCLAQLTKPMAFNQSCYGLTGKEGIIENDFLYYLMHLKTEELKRKTHGAVFDTITKETFNHIEVDIPSIATQREIAKILGDIDNKIKLNHQTNQTLEQIAQAIFKSWFVDFDPTRAKIAAKEHGEGPEIAAMCAISGKTTEELQKLSTEQFEELRNTASLFPEALIDSELGEIPEGWAFTELKSIAKFAIDRVDVSDLSLQNYVSTENMLENKKGIRDASSLPTVNTVPKFIPNQILISNIRPYFKKIWLARFVGGRSNDVLGIEALNPIYIDFLFNLLFQDTFFNFMMTTSKGAKMPRGDKKAIIDWQFVRPSQELFKAYSLVIKDFNKFIHTNIKENESLSSLRETLLPKLLSGELSGETSKETTHV